MAVRLQEVERAYFVRKLGGTQEATRRLSEIKREYMSKTIGGAPPTMPMDQLETLWLISVINSDDDPVDQVPVSDRLSDLWRQAVISVAKVPATTINENKIIFYINAS